MSFLSLALDIVIAALLIATIVYASVLNRKLATLRNTKQEMEALATRLVDSTERAEKALSELKAAASEDGGNLEKNVSAARGLVDDLRFLVDKGTALADRLTGEIGKARGGTPGSAKAATDKRPERNTPTDGGRSRATAAAGPRPAAARATERRWDDEEDPEADSQLMKALRRVR